MSGWLQLHVATHTFTFLTRSTNSDDAAFVCSLSAPVHPEINPILRLPTLQQRRRDEERGQSSSGPGSCHLGGHVMRRLLQPYDV